MLNIGLCAVVFFLAKYNRPSYSMLIRQKKLIEWLTKNFNSIDRIGERDWLCFYRWDVGNSLFFLVFPQWKIVMLKIEIKNYKKNRWEYNVHKEGMNKKNNNPNFFPLDLMIHFLPVFSRDEHGLGFFGICYCSSVFRRTCTRNFITTFPTRVVRSSWNF